MNLVCKTFCNLVETNKILKNINLFFYLLFTTFLTSCAKENDKNTNNNYGELNVEVKYSKGFNINYLNNFKTINITQPYPNSKDTFSYQFSSLEKLNDKRTIKTPIEKIIVSSTTHIPMLELLDAENTLVGFQSTKYISSLKTRKLVDAGKITELGNKGALNTEIVMSLQPDLVVGFSMSGSSKVYKSVEKANIPVILNGDWLEETPLGRAEWIKFFGVLFDREAKADSIFKVIEDNYNRAKEIANNAKTQPSILSGAIMSKDIWNLPAGNSFVAQFLKDANLNYLWQDSKGKGSLSLSFESVYEKGKDADIWIAPGYFSTKEQMLNSNSKYKEFKSFKNDNVYTFSNKKGPTGGVIYYELAPTRPDLVLKDIIKITHPDLLPDYKLTFFEKMK